MSVLRARATWRQRGTVLLVACATGAALSNAVVPAATAAEPTATQFASVVVTGIAPPASGPNNPSAVVAQGVPFTVSVSFSDGEGNPLPPSWNKASTVTLSVEPGSVPSEAGNAALGTQKTLVVPAGQTGATASGFSVSPADNRIRLGAQITAGSKDAKAIPKGFSAEFDIVIDTVSSASNDTFVSTSGDGTECAPTRQEPYCVDLYLPDPTVDGTLLTVGKCDSFLGCASTSQRVIQILAAFGPGTSAATPAVAVYKCDKSACPGGGVPSYRLLVNLAATGPLSYADACAEKGVVTDPAVGYCVDYVQSKRDNAGDLHLYLLLARDARGSCC